MSNYVCYVIQTPNGRRSYVGVTTNLARRLRQHCGKLTGGAKYTRGKTWEYAALVKGFDTKNQVLSFEWWVKHQSRKCRGRPIERRFTAIRKLLQNERWSQLQLGFVDKQRCSNEKDWYVLGELDPNIWVQNT